MSIEMKCHKSSEVGNRSLTRVMKKHFMEEKCHLNSVLKDEPGLDKQIKERAARMEGENGLKV